jgi:hypothetical protein
MTYWPGSERWGDLLEKRRRLIEAWATFAETKPAAGKVVVPMRRGPARALNRWI